MLLTNSSLFGQDGGILVKFFFRVFMDRDEVEVNKHAKKNKAMQYPAILTEQAWSIKDLLYGQKENFFPAGPTREIPDGQDEPILPARVANQNTGFASSYPLADSTM